MIYIDTSAFLAMINSEDPNHDLAMKTWRQLIEEEQTLVCNNYVIVESIALIQRRVNLRAVSILHNDILPFVEIDWLEEELHNAIVKTLLKNDRRQISLVDHSSFDTMRRRGIQTAFGFDSHFSEQGFDIIP
jgi:predicted nucleic acid-binding protein